MNSKHFSCILILLLSLLLTGCVPVYMPNTINPHQLMSAEELHFSAHTGMNDIDLAATYSVNDYVAVTAGGSFSNKNNSSDNDYHKHSFIEAGAMLYTPLGEVGTCSAAAGVGRGTSTSRDNYEFYGEQSLVAEGIYNRIFIQQNLGLITDYFELMLGTRFSYVKFSSFRVVEDDNYSENRTYDGSLHSWFFEPAATVKLGAEFLKFVVQAGISKPMNENLQFEWQPLLFTVGIELTLD